ncbi:hypothetical protein BASA62_010024 [Batrachochytrium salamandrivorans]|nr:hypothetical protein BASA62_010024 [Batrachochytrium salamandrivorans]
MSSRLSLRSVMDGNNGSQVPQGDAPVTGRQVFLGNLPFTIQSKDLKDLFEKNGGISNVAVMLHANGRSRGFGLVTCESAETAQLLISQFRDLELLGRRIEVRLDRVGRAYNNLADDRKPHDGQSLSKRHAPQYANPPTTTTAACTPDSVSGTSAPQIASVAAAAAMLSNAPVSSTSSYHSLGAVGMYHPAIAAPTTNSYAHNWTPDTDHGFHPAVVDYNALQTFDVGNAIAGIDLNPGTRILVTPGVQDASYYSNNGGTATPPTQGSHSPPANGDPSVWTDTPPHTASDVPAAPSTFSNGGTNLFVGNLPFSTTWQGLKDLFRRAGDVVRAQVPIDSSGRSRGFGVVTMAQPEDAAKAVEMLNDFVFMGRSLEVREDRNTSKSFRTEGDQHEGGGYNGGYRTRKQTKGPPSVPSGNQEDQTDVTHPKDNQFLSNGSDPNTGDASGPTLFVWKSGLRCPVAGA